MKEYDPFNFVCGAVELPYFVCSTVELSNSKKQLTKEI